MKPPLVRDSEPIRLLVIPTSIPSLYMLIYIRCNIDRILKLLCLSHILTILFV